MTPLEQASFLGNGVGVVYYTGPTGVLIPTDPHWSRGEANGGLALKRVRNLATIARKSAYGTAATFTITVTSAAAGNITALTIDGVAQLTPPIAITAGDEDATAASIATAINTLVASPDYSAYSVGDTVFGRCNTVGPANSDKTIVLTNTGLSTFSYSSVTAGGTDSNQYNTRIFLDLDPAADPAVLNTGSAVEITSAVAALPPYTVADVAVVGAALTADRQDRDNAIAVMGGGTINNINITDAILGDVLLVYPKAGEPAITIATGAGNIVLSTGTSFVSASASNGIALQYRLISAGPPATYGWVEYSSRITATPTALRSSGSYVPLVAGSLAIPTILGGGITPFTPGGTDNYNAYLTGPGVLAGGGFSVPLVAGANIDDGDNGTIYGNGIALTGDPLTVAGFIVPAALKATGLWSIDWRYVNGGFIVMPSWDLVNTPDWITTSMVAPSAITNTELATGIDGAKITDGTIGFVELSAAVNAAIAGNGVQVTAAITIAAASVGGAATPVGLTVPANMAAVVETMLYRITTYTAPAHAAGDIGVRCVGATQEQALATVTKSLAGRWKATITGEGAAAESMLLLGQDLEIYTTGIGGGGSNIDVIIFYRLVQL